MKETGSYEQKSKMKLASFWPWPFCLNASIACSLTLLCFLGPACPSCCGSKRFIEWVHMAHPSTVLFTRAEIKMFARLFAVSTAPVTIVLLDGLPTCPCWSIYRHIQEHSFDRYKNTCKKFFFSGKSVTSKNNTRTTALTCNPPWYMRHVIANTLRGLTNMRNKYTHLSEAGISLTTR